MKFKSAWLTLLIVGVLFGLAPGASADSLKYKGTVNGSYWGPYVGPYLIEVNGGVATPMICDDYDARVPPSAWNADPLTGLQFAQARFGYLSDAEDRYRTAGILAEQLLALPLTPNPTNATRATQIQLAYAIWATFQETNLLAPTANGNALKYLVGHPGPGALYLDGAKSAMAQAYNNRATFDLARLEIQAPNPGSPGPGVAVSQEFIKIKTPEAPVVAALGLNLLVLGALGFVFRRRIVQLD